MALALLACLVELSGYGFGFVLVAGATLLRNKLLRPWSVSVCVYVCVLGGGGGGEGGGGGGGGGRGVEWGAGAGGIL